MKRYEQPFKGRTEAKLLLPRSITLKGMAREIEVGAGTPSEVAGVKIDEVFVGFCMTNIGHFRAASKLFEGKPDIPVKLWIAPLTKMNA